MHAVSFPAVSRAGHRTNKLRRALQAPGTNEHSKLTSNMGRRLGVRWHARSDQGAMPCTRGPRALSHKAVLIGDCRCCR